MYDWENMETFSKDILFRFVVAWEARSNELVDVLFTHTLPVVVRLLRPYYLTRYSNDEIIWSGADLITSLSIIWLSNF